MGIDMGKVLGLVAQRPGIRTVEIADLIDCEPEQVEPSLREHMARGDIVMLPVRAPNGKPANAFEFSKAFKQTEAFQALMAVAAPAPEPVQLGQVAAPTVPRVTPPAVQRFAPAPVPAAGAVPVPVPLTKAEMAIAHIESKVSRSATSSELHKVLGLKAGQHVSGFLGSALKAGRLVNRCQIWTIGEPAQPAPPAQAAQAVTVDPVRADIPVEAGPAEAMHIPTFLKKDVAIIKSIADYAGGAPEPIVAAPAPAPALGEVQPEFRCAYWSDGTLELQRGGQQIAVLSPAERRTVVAFTGKLYQ